MEKNMNRCHCCGNDLGQSDFIHIEKTWGYFSKNKDGQRHSLNVCEQCYDSWICQFKYAPEIEEITEWL